MNTLNHSFNRLIFSATLVLFTSSQAVAVDNCDKSNPAFDDVQLRIPRVSVAGQADIVDCWATLHYVPELSHDGRFAGCIPCTLTIWYYKTPATQV